MDNQIINVNYNGIKFLGVVIKVYDSVQEDFYDDVDGTHGVQTVDTMLVYAQNRLVEVQRVRCKYDDEDTETIRDYVAILVDYCQISEYDDQLSKAMAHNDSIREMMAFGFTFKESENIVNGLNPDGSKRK